ncbi:unnamed protein product, partial [Discosporangium mesarthrocarpum]
MDEDDDLADIALSSFLAEGDSFPDMGGGRGGGGGARGNDDGRGDERSHIGRREVLIGPPLLRCCHCGAGGAGRVGGADGKVTATQNQGMTGRNSMLPVSMRWDSTGA